MKKRRVQQRLKIAVDDLEGLASQEQGPNEQRKDMIEDLYRQARRQGSRQEARETPTSDFSTLLQATRTPMYDGASF
jgi:hypothetical protein